MKNIFIFCDLPHVSPVVNRLVLAGFYYGGQISLDEIYEYDESETEDYGDWQIQTYPVVAVGHIYSGHYWLRNDDCADDIAALIDG